MTRFVCTFAKIRENNRYCNALNVSKCEYCIDLKYFIKDVKRYK